MEQELCRGIPEERRGLRMEMVLHSKMPYSKNPYRHCSLTLLQALPNPVSTGEMSLRGVTPTVIKKPQGSPICVLQGRPCQGEKYRGSSREGSTTPSAPARL